MSSSRELKARREKGDYRRALKREVIAIQMGRKPGECVMHIGQEYFKELVLNCVHVAEK